MEAHSDPMTAFKDADYALLVGARPRGPGMERKDLLSANAQIFTAQGKALDEVASRNVKVLVVGNPANTNAYIAMKSAPDLPRKNFTAMLRLDHNRALSQLAAKTGKPVADIEKLTVWGNHSPTMYADYRFATVERQVGQGHDQRPGLEQATSSCRPSASAAPRSSRRAACRRRHRPPTPPSTTCATGRSAPTASGSRWASRPTASTASPKDIMFGFPVTTARTASTSSSKAWRSTPSARSASTLTLNELQGRTGRRQAPAVSALQGPARPSRLPRAGAGLCAPHMSTPATCSSAPRRSTGSLPVCDHYSGVEARMRKSLQLQAEMTQEFGACVFDVTLDCEDGAPVGR